LDNPTSGEILYEGKHLNEVGVLSTFRRNFIGFIFQFHHLIPVLTLRENIESALLSNHNISAIERSERAISLLDEMGILHRADSFASKISGGERQRGAIARALINNPKATHDNDVAAIADVLIKMEDGKIISIETNQHMEMT